MITHSEKVEKKVREFYKNNPDGTRAECNRETKVSLPTIDKYRKIIEAESLIIDQYIKKVQDEEKN